VAADKPNILFIMTDQQFADAMSCRMGKQYLHTPAMDSLAQKGMLFTRAYAANPLCMPSRSSIFSGRYPHETGVTKNGKEVRDPKDLVCLGAYFRDAGYDTAYCGKWHMMFKQNLESGGFKKVAGDHGGGPDAVVADGAAKFLAQPHDKPFLLVASFLNPHNICEWARRLAGREQRLSCGEIGEPPPLDQLPPAPANLAPPLNEPDGMTLMMRRAYHVETGGFPVGKFTVEDWRKQRWGYYRMIEKVDAEIGKVLEALRQAGLEDNTLVVFTADHGECAGAHGFNQKTVLYEESARVPLIIAGKGRTTGGKTDKLVNTGIDLLPTMLDFAGLTIPGQLPGRSLLPLALGKAVPVWREYVVVQDNMTQVGLIDGMKPTMEGRMVRSDRYKYCLYSHGQQRESLVDLQADPGETRDLAADPKYRQVLLEHRDLLAQFGREHKDALATELLANNVKPTRREV
jgi:arylsulfatase A-like enzyme